MIDPASFTPNRKWQGGIDSKEIQFGVMAFVTEFGLGIPVLRKFISTIGHVFATKYSHCKHLLWCQIWLEFRMKLLAHRLSKIIDIAFLHEIVNDDFSSIHLITIERPGH